MRIKITPRSNVKLLENFPNDPYTDIKIITNKYTYNLVLAYLAIDSIFFANLPPTTKQVHIKQLPEEELNRVLRSLYGDELEASSCQQLQRLYRVIECLDIQEYKNKIAKEIINNKQLRNSIPIIQFSFRNDLVFEKIRDFHLENNLQVLGSSKNYLQLNQISRETLNDLLLDYQELVDSTGDDIINHILENYFNRNNIQPAQYFQKTELQPLKHIWQNHHHNIHFKELIKYKRTESLNCNRNVVNRKESFDTKTKASQSDKLLMQIQALKKKVTKQDQLLWSRSSNQKSNQQLHQASYLEHSEKGLTASEKIQKKAECHNNDLTYSQQAVKSFHKIALIKEKSMK